jgi:hypothetical protein
LRNELEIHQVERLSNLPQTQMLDNSKPTKQTPIVTITKLWKHEKFSIPFSWSARITLTSSDDDCRSFLFENNYLKSQLIIIEKFSCQRLT